MKNILLAKPDKIFPSKKISYFYKKITKNPRYLLVFLLARFRWIRWSYFVISKLIWQGNKIPIHHSESLFTHLDTSNIIKTLKKDGIFDGISLPQPILENILDYVYAHDCFANGKINKGFKIGDKSKVDELYGHFCYVARYFNISTSCDSISKLAKDPKLWEIATQYIGPQAKYTGASLYWTFPLMDNLKPYEFSQFHYDLEDYNSLRFCFYLSDVTLESGPHICICGSHKRKPISSIVNLFSRIYPEQKLVEFYGIEKFHPLIGKAGSGFIEDVFCFHRGAIPQKQPRLFLQLHFATNSYVNQEYHDSRNPDLLKSL